MIVMKFGGSSLADAGRIRRVASIIRGRLRERPVVVVSALGGATDELLKAAREALTGGLARFEAVRERHLRTARSLGKDPSVLGGLSEELLKLLQGVSLLRELTPRTLDHVASFGERMSARLVAACLRGAGLPARPFDAFDLGLWTDDRFGSANPLPDASARIRRAFRRVRGLPVVTGFIGRTSTGEVTTLGRNGSDYSATVFGAALGARRVEIWSDTDGVMTADPRVAPDAKPLERISFEEAGELAYYGGRVLHPHTLVPAIEKGIPIRVLNTFRPGRPGTEILRRVRRGRSGVQSIAFRRHQRIVSVSSPRMLLGFGFLARIFEAFARHEIVIHMVSTSEVTVSATTDDPHNLEKAVRELSREFEVTVEKDKAIVCVVGEGIRSTPGIAGEAFSAVREAGANVLMISQGASKINLAFLIEDSEVEKVVRALHKRFFGS